MMKSKKVRWPGFLCLVGLLLSAGFAQGTDSNDILSQPHVRILLFSGRPNPTINLSADDLRRLLRSVGEMPIDRLGKKENVWPNKSGYTGFMVIIPSATPPDHQILMVYGKAVELRTFTPATGKESTAVFRRDDGYSLENDLVKRFLAKPDLPPDLKALITKEVPAARAKK
jgi:hypothetical protein